MNVKFSKVGEKEVTRAIAGEFVKYFHPPELTLTMIALTRSWRAR